MINENECKRQIWDGHTHHMLVLNHVSAMMPINGMNHTELYTCRNREGQVQVEVGGPPNLNCIRLYSDRSMI